MPGRRARRRDDHPEGAGRDLRARRRGGRVPAAATPDAAIERLGPEGEWREPPAPVLRVAGPARALLTAERTALNFLGRLSGVATETAQVVRAVRAAGGDRASPRHAQDHARAARAREGGGRRRRRRQPPRRALRRHPHQGEPRGAGRRRRRGGAARAGGAAGPAARGRGARRARDRRGARGRRAAAAARQHEPRAGRRGGRAQPAGRAELEASGGVTPETVVVYSTIKGLDYVSMGALTHSAPGLDLSMLLEVSP